jgi:hypothetical protein
VVLEQRTDLAGGTTAAVFDPARTHRYLLTRIWDPSRPPAVFVMLNPSTADALSVGPHKIGRWAFVKSTMLKSPLSTSQVSAPSKLLLSWVSPLTQSAWRCAGKPYRFAMVDGSKWTTNSSQNFMPQGERLTASLTTFSSAGLSCARAWTDRASAAGDRLTTGALKQILTGLCSCIRKNVAQRPLRWPLEYRRALSWRSFMNAVCELETGSTFWTKRRSERLSSSTELAAPCKTSRSVLPSRNGRSALLSEGSVSHSPTGALQTGFEESAWERAEPTLESASTTPTPWRACGRPADSLPSTGWSWRGISDDHCWLAKRSTTSTTTGTTTGSRTCNFASASTEGAMSSDVATAGLIGFSLRRSHSRFGAAA